MKKFGISLILAIMQIVALQGIVFAQETTSSTQSSNAIEKAKSERLLLTEIPLGAKGCKCATLDQEGKVKEEELGICKNRAVHERLYVCESVSITTLIQGIVAWIMQIAILLGVLATAILGVAWAIAGADNPEYKKKLKEWLVGLIIGLIILYGFQYILGMFGWIYKTGI